MRETKYHIIKGKRTGFTRFDKSVETSVRTDEAFLLKKNHHYDIIFSVRGQDKKFFRIQIPPVVGEINSVKLIRSSLDIIGEIILDVILVEYDCSYEEMQKYKDSLKKEVDIGFALFGEQADNGKTVSELYSEVTDLFNQRRKKK